MITTRRYFAEATLAELMHEPEVITAEEHEILRALAARVKIWTAPTELFAKDEGGRMKDEEAGQPLNAS